MGLPEQLKKCTWALFNMIIFKTTDRVPVKIADVTFWISPLTLDQRRQINDLTKLSGGAEKVDGFSAAEYYVKFGVKSIDGLTLADGSAYQCAYGEDGTLDDATLGDIFQLGCFSQLITACTNLSAIAANKIEGVSIDLKAVKASKKK